VVEKKKRTSGEAMVHTAVVLPPEMLAELRKQGALHGRTMSQEIRERLAGSLFEETRDDKTKQLEGEIVQLAAEVLHDFKTHWHAEPRAHKAFLAAVADQIGSYEPPPTPASGSPDVNDLDPPDVIGRALARRYRREREAVEAQREAMANYRRGHGDVSTQARRSRRKPKEE
jgi:hypothetical protein